MAFIRQPWGNLKNCKVCGKVFLSMRGENMCPICLPLEEEKRKKVIEYLREHPGAPVIEVLKEAKISGEMGNSHEVEDMMFNEGLIEGAPHQNTCASCGAPISDGLTYCKRCFQGWMRTIQSHAITPPSYAVNQHNARPGDPDRAAAIDVAMLKYSAAAGGSRDNRPHGPGQEPSDGRKRPQHYLGIIERREPRR